MGNPFLIHTIISKLNKKTKITKTNELNFNGDNKSYFYRATAGNFLSYYRSHL